MLWRTLRSSRYPDTPLSLGDVMSGDSSFELNVVISFMRRSKTRKKNNPVNLKASLPCGDVIEGKHRSCSYFWGTSVPKSIGIPPRSSRLFGVFPNLIASSLTWWKWEGMKRSWRWLEVLRVVGTWCSRGLLSSESLAEGPDWGRSEV